jgi:hypothetical protein
MLKINGAWYLDSLPMSVIIEREDGSLHITNITPYRELSDKDLQPYPHPLHPRRQKGYPVPEYTYKFYGLEKSAENATEVIHVRLTPAEKSILQVAADGDNKPVSEFVRGWIRTL